MPTTTQQQYFENPDLHGNYQFIPYTDILNTLELLTEDDASHLKNINRSQLILHSKRAIKEFARQVPTNNLAIEVEIGETLSDVDVLDKIATIENKQVIMNITNALNSDKSIQEYEKQVKASITKSKQDLKEIQPRIDEVLKTKSESHDFESLRTEQSKQEKRLLEVEKSISDKANAFDVVLETENKKKLEANSIKSKIQVIEQTSKTDFDNLNKKDNTKLLSEQSILSSKELELKLYFFSLLESFQA